MHKILAKTMALSRMVKIEHSIFALPFAYAGAFLAAGGWPGWRAFVFLSLAMVAVRSFAMAMNRVMDLKYDALNPRTTDRPLVTGELGLGETWVFIAVCAMAFVLFCWGMNLLCLALSPVALLWSAFYSLTKRFTWLCHFVLGSVLALAPLAGWISTGSFFSLPAVLLFFGVLFWVAGFDLLYACQDVEFDREHGLQSVPAVLGVPTALAISAFCHVNTAIFFLLAGWAAWLAWPYYLVWAVISVVLILEHRLISADDMSRVNLAFFTLNGVVGIVFFCGVLWAVL